MPHTARMRGSRKLSNAMKFVLLIGVLSFFADFVYEGARSITGPFLGVLGATGVIVSIVAGLGEFLGYGLRLVSGPWAERSGRFWPITIAGYVIQMTAVPLLALATNWQIAALLIVLERVGKAVRNPPRDVMLSYAARDIGYGWGFGVHEALDQFGALCGPLAMAAVLAFRHEFNQAFAVLVIPAVITLALLAIARLTYPNPHDAGSPHNQLPARDGFPTVFWLYLVGAMLVAAGFADFPLISFHLQSGALHDRQAWLPVFYAVAMAVSGLGSLGFGKLFDRFGLIVLVPLTLVAAAFAPLVFMGGFGLALFGSALWGLGMGVHESLIPAAVAHMVPQQRRGSAYGIFTGSYGIAWFAGSIVIGVLYGHHGASLGPLIAFCVVSQLIAIPIFIAVSRRVRTGESGHA
ncbi:MAG: MFS transporter [Candidatus Baltobacteraceae bacterium]